MVEGDVVEVGKHRDQVRPDPVQARDKGAEQGQANQAQRLLVDLFDIQGRLLDHGFRAFAAVLALCLAFGRGALVGQATCCHAQAAHEGGLDDQPDHQQIQGVDQAVTEFQCGVVIAEADRDDQRQWQQAQADADQHAEG